MSSGISHSSCGLSGGTNNIPSSHGISTQLTRPEPVIYHSLRNAAGTTLSATTPRAGEAVLAGSPMIGRAVRRLRVLLRKTGTPSGDVTATIRDTGDSIVATFAEVYASANIPTTDTYYTFHLPSVRSLAAGDRILLEYGGASGVQLRRSGNPNDTYGGTATTFTSYNGVSYTEINVDIVATMWGF